MTVQALNGCGTVDMSYTSTVAFSSSDPVADLPTNYTFTAADNGVKTFTNGVRFNTGGSRTLAVTDTINSGLTDTKTVAVSGFAVISSSDPGDHTPPPGTLSYALKNASPANGQLVTFKATVTTVTVADKLPDVPKGVTIDGGNCSSPVTIRGGNTLPASTDGLTLKGGVTLQNLRVANFTGRQVALTTTLGNPTNRLICTKIVKTFP